MPTEIFPNMTVAGVFFLDWNQAEDNFQRFPTCTTKNRALHHRQPFEKKKSMHHVLGTIIGLLLHTSDVETSLIWTQLVSLKVSTPILRWFPWERSSTPKSGRVCVQMTNNCTAVCKHSFVFPVCEHVQEEYGYYEFFDRFQFFWTDYRTLI